MLMLEDTKLDGWKKKLQSSSEDMRKVGRKD